MTREVLTSGFGYWLINHKKQMSQKELQRYRQRILHIYRQTSIEEFLERNPVAVILVSDPNRYPLEGFGRETAENYTLIYPTQQSS
jgi:hypothetical protein